jgi:hypothetical protein
MTSKLFKFSMAIMGMWLQGQLVANEGGVCHMCEVIREENKHKVNPYEYYEDYLKDHPPAPSTPQKEENSKSTEQTKSAN